jgi:DNA-directed RNA polymerase specialized sigma54-like protein
MEMRMSLTPKLEQRLSLAQTIDFARLMSVPDEVIATVEGVISLNPEVVENVLRNRRTYSTDNANKVQVIYSEFIPTEAGAKRNTSSGLIISPDISALKDSLGSYDVNVTPDVTYIGRQNEKPEVVFSDHLKGAIGLRLIQVESSEFPETARLLAQLRRFDEWRRSTLRKSYLILGEEQREFFEGFDPMKYNPFNQEDLARRLEISGGTVSRIFNNRWVEARNLEGIQRFLYAKDFFVSRYDLKRYASVPRLNEILRQEFETGQAFSDDKIAELEGRIARRTVTKYRRGSKIPDSSDRTKLYRSGEIKEPYQIV